MFKHDRKLRLPGLLITTYCPPKELKESELEESTKSVSSSLPRCYSFLKQYAAMFVNAPEQQVAECTQHEMTQLVPIGVNWWLFTSKCPECTLNTHTRVIREADQLLHPSLFHHFARFINTLWLNSPNTNKLTWNIINMFSSKENTWRNSLTMLIAYWCFLQLNCFKA